MIRTAVISPCTKFRYELCRVWDSNLPELLFIMLNPSRADDQQDDPTIRKCIGFATRLGYGSIRVVNLFAYRATDPADLKAAGYLVGDQNDEWIERGVRECDAIAYAWGANARNLSRPAHVMAIVRAHDKQAIALKLTHDGRTDRGRMSRVVAFHHVETVRGHVFGMATVESGVLFKRRETREVFRQAMTADWFYVDTCERCPASLDALARDAGVPE